MVDTLLKYKIEADGKQAKAEIKDVDKLFSKLGGSASLKDVISKAKTEFGSLESIAEKAASSIAVPFSAAATAITGVATAVAATGVTIGLTLFKLSKDASDYGSAIYDASVKTGLHAETLSAMRVAGDQSETSFEQITKAISKYTIQVSDAANGSKKAEEAMTRLGINPKKAILDLDGSLAAVFQKIQNAKNPFDRAGLAAAAFGKKMGAELLPFIDQFNGNLPELIERAKRLGETIGDQDAKAADEFGDVMVDLEKQLASVGRTIGLEVMPEFTRFAHQLSDWLANNKGEIKNWATVTEEALSGLIGYWEDLAKAVEKANKGNNPQSPGYPNQYNPNFDLFKKLRERGRERLNEMPIAGEINASIRSTGFDLSELDKVTRIKPPKTSDSEFRKFFEDFGFEVERTFGKAINKGSLHPSGKAIDIRVNGKSPDEIAKLVGAALEKGYRFVDERVKQPGIKQTGPHLHFEQNEGAKASIFGPASSYGDVPLGLLQELDKRRLGKGAAGSDAVAKFNKDANDKILADRRKFNEESAALFRAESDTRIATLDQALKHGLILESTYAAQVGGIRLDQLELERGQAETKNEQAVIDEKIAKQKIENEEALLDAWAKEGMAVAAVTQKLIEQQKAAEDLAHAKSMMFLDQFKPGYDYLGNETMQPEDVQGQGGAYFGSDWLGLDKIQSSADVYKGVLADMKSMTADTFGAMADAVGQSIEAWVLYGDSIGQSLKKATASILANLAAQAATKAIWELAEGFAMLALAFFGHPGAGASATAHFTAAAIYGSIALGAALAGRGIAGDSFKNGGKGGASGSTSSASPKQIDQNPQPYSRQTETTFVSSRHDGLFGNTMERLNKVLDKLEPMKPGDVLAAGMRQNRGAVTNQVISDMKSNSGYTNQVNRVLGAR